ncbi:MAG: murein biosynthesis integral membrane protein MurJ [Alphaproteobacteria bacterium]|nr:murein biosynthesis integral membrane protein MurJ [Alphaproteobacteria bacterium]
MKGGFAHSLFTVSGLTVLSRVGGFVRDFLTAIFLGAGPVADAFFVAQRLPNLFRSLFAEGAFSAAFVPLYTSENKRHGQEAAQRFAGNALMLLLGALIPFSVLIMAFMPYVVRLMAPGFEPGTEKYDLAVQFCTITFPYLILISVTALQTSVLNAHDRFAPGAAAPIAFNLVLIAGLLLAHVFGWHTGYTLAWAVSISGVIQCAWLALSCYRARLTLPFVQPYFDQAAKDLFHRIGPGAIGAGAAQINLLVSTVLASTLSTGAVSWLFYADRLNQLPLGIVGIAVATTLLPLLSRHIEAGEEDRARHHSSRAIEFCVLLGLPATLGLIILAEPIIGTLFQHGAFTASDTQKTAEALQAYALGVPAFLLVKVFASIFFARHDTKTPVKVAIKAMLVNVVFSIALLGLLQHVGIALANSLAVSVNALLLYRAIRQKKFPLAEPGLPLKIAKIAVSSALMGLIAYGLMGLLWSPASPLSHRIGILTLLIGVSGLSYFGALFMGGSLKDARLKEFFLKK